MIKGSKATVETRQKMSDAHKGVKRPDVSAALKGKKRPKVAAKQRGQKRTPEQCRRISEGKMGGTRTPVTDETRKKLSVAGMGHTVSEENRRKRSATHQGIPYDEWETFASEKKYCPKFNDACKESNREKYGRECFICGKTEKANGRKRSVHHVDMDKAQGCESNWKLVPLCMKCHSKAHNDELVARLGYLLK